MLHFNKPFQNGDSFWAEGGLGPACEAVKSHANWLRLNMSPGSPIPLN